MKRISEQLAKLASKVSICSSSLIKDNARAIMFIFGAVLLVGGLDNLAMADFDAYVTADYNDTRIKNAVGNLFAMIEGAFGALIMVVAGLGAIVAAAMGAYRAAVGMLVVAVGAFILRSLVSLFFGQDFAGTGLDNIGG